MKKLYLFVFTLFCAGISFGQVKIGTTNYANLKSAFDAINSNAFSGAVVIEITSDVTDNQEAILNTQPSSPNVTSILIKPAAGSAQFTLNFNSRLYVKRGGFTIDGENRLTIRQNVVGSYGISFVGPIQNITVTNCKIIAAERGICINLDTATAYSGNITNVTVTNCDLSSTNYATPIKYGIYSSEHSTPGGTVRNGIFTSNKIHDFGDNPTTMYSAGISLYETAGILIDANKFYQSVSRSYNVLNAIELRYVMTFTGDGPTTISNNVIGGANDSNTGTWDMLSGSFTAISVDAFSANYTISNNTIRRIAMADGNSGTAAGFTGIYARKGDAVVTGNTIGATDGTNSIAMNYAGSTKTAFVYGVNSAIATSTTTVSNNNIGGISVNGSGRYEMAGIINSASTGLALFNCDNNMIGSLSGYFMTCTSTATGCGISGIKQYGPRLGSINSNTISGFTGNFPGTDSVLTICGIDYTDTNQNGPPRIISSNLVQNIRNINSGNKSYTSGIRAFTSEGEIQCEKNQVYGISSNSTNSGSEASGISIQAASLTCRNNMVSIGADITSGPTIYGIITIRGTGGGGRYCQNNSIYVGGTKTAGDAQSIAYYNLGNGSANGNYMLEIVDNIFANVRTNTGSASGGNYSARISSQHYSRSNLFYGTGNGYVMSGTLSTDIPTLAQINALASTESPSFFGNPQFISATNLHIKPSIPTIIESRGYGNLPYVPVLVDVDNQTRSDLSPNDIGADAGNFLPITAPTISGISATSICSSSTFTINGGSFYDISSVRVGSTSVPFTVTGTSQIVVTPPNANLSGQVAVENIAGSATSSQSISITALPVISSQPQSVTMCPGSVTFSVVASNATSYQWRRNGVNLTNSGAYSNVNTATLQLTNPDYTQSGIFDVVLTSANGICSVTSATATLAFSGTKPIIYAAGNATSCNGQPVTLTTSNPNSALQFDGVNDYVDVPRTFSNDFTIEFWMKTTQNGGGSGAWTNGKGLVDCYGATYENSASFGTSLLGSKLAFGLGEFYDYNPYSITSATAINTGQWVHVAVTRKDGSGEMKIYINGVLDASGTSPQNGGLTPGSIRLGGIGAGGNFYNGSLDEVKMWNTVRNAAQIAQDMVSDFPAGTANLVSNYRFGEGSGSTVANLSNGNTSTLMNGVSWTTRPIAPPADATFLWSNGATTPDITVAASGTYTVAITSGGCSVTSLPTVVNINTAPAISGSSNFVAAGNSSTLTATGSNTFNWTPSTGLNTTTGATVIATPSVTTTYTATVPGCGSSATFTVKVLPATSASDNALDFDGVDDFVTIPAQNTSVGGNFTVMMWVKPTHPTKNMVLFGTRSGGNLFDIQILGGNQIHGDIGNGNDWLTTSANANFNYQANQWLHVAYVVTPSGYKIYANGNEVGSGNYLGTPLLYNAVATMVLGKNTGENTLFQGTMDDLVIYASALSALDVYNSARAPIAGWIANYSFDEGIAGGNNQTITILNENNTSANFHGTLNNFTLNGASGNWVVGQSVQNQAIAFNPLPTVEYGSNLALSATASSGLDVAFTSSNPSVATISGAGIVLTGVGTTTVSATQSGNAFYNPATTVSQTLTVTPKSLTIASATAQNKTYDRTTDATITGTLSGVVNSDNVTFAGTGTFASMNVGNGISVTSTAVLTGSQSGNYTLMQPVNLAANITPKALAVNNAVANNKVYDGTTAAIITSATLSGIISPDSVNIASNAGTFASANVGNDIAVTSQLTLGGANAGNYSLTQPTGLLANIMAQTVTATLSGTTSICLGQSAALNVVITGIPAAYTVQYTDGTLVYTANNYNSGQPIPVSPANTSTYTLVSVSNANATVSLVGSATVTVTPQAVFYQDFDGDGYGNAAILATTCSGAPTGYVSNNTDCNDNDAAIHATFSFYADADHDGYGIGNLTSVCAINAATPPIGYSGNNTDCNDSDAAMHAQFPFYVDADFDTYGTGNLVNVCAVNASTPPSGYSTNNTDCNDSVAAVNPGHAEIPYNGIDDNCNGIIDEGSQIFSQVLPSQCGTTLASISSLIGAVNYISPVDGYRFKVTNTVTNSVQIIDRVQPNFAFSMLPSYDYATTYSISVMVRRNGIWLNYYGPSCLVSSPAILVQGGAAAVSSSQCGVVLPSLSTLIATTSLPGVTGYRFRITNLTDATGNDLVQTLDRAQNWFALTMLNRFNYGTTYQVEVAVKTNGNWTGFGSPCNVSSPAVPTLANCGATISTSGTKIPTTSLDRVVAYRFEITNMTNFAQVTVDKSTNWFTFNDVSGFVAGGSYAVRVAVQVSGYWSPFGENCLITAPGASRSIVKDDKPETQTVVFNATAYPNPYSDSFALDLETPNDEPVRIKVYDMIGKLIEEREFAKGQTNAQHFGERYPSGVYNIVLTQSDFVKTLRVIKR